MLERRFTVNTPIDLGAIDAVGFDLDHTLIDYDDPAVNALAYTETCEILVEECGQPPGLMDVPYANDDVIRGLVIDLERGNLLKLGPGAAVSRGVRDGTWLSRDEIDRLYGGGFPFSGEHWVINSPFDLPTAFLYQTISRLRAGGATADCRLLCGQIRTTLDRAHVRGRFKPEILRDIDAYVRPQPEALERVTAYRRAGKRVFVVTNSPPDYTARMLAHALGPRWHAYFDYVAADAAKPAFFDDDGRVDRARDVGGAVTPTTTGGSYRDVERRLGASGGAILLVGDNPRSDIAAARRAGWRTAMVVPELREGYTAGNGWGSPLADADAPTWFAETIAAHADVYAPTLGELLSAPALSP